MIPRANAYLVQLLGGPLDGVEMVVPIFDRDPLDGQWPTITAQAPQFFGDTLPEAQVRVVELHYKVEPNPADDGPLFLARFQP